VVHPRKLLAQHVVDAPVAEPAAHQSRLPNLFTQAGVELAGLRRVAVAVAGEPHKAAGVPLREVMLFNHLSDGVAPRLWG
jgi:hypothetical protein